MGPQSHVSVVDYYTDVVLPAPAGILASMAATDFLLIH
jgi:hypothetical protein